MLQSLVIYQVTCQNDWQGQTSQISPLVEMGRLYNRRRLQIQHSILYVRSNLHHLHCELCAATRCHCLRSCCCSCVALESLIVDAGYRTTGLLNKVYLLLAYLLCVFYLLQTLLRWWELPLLRLYLSLLMTLQRCRFASWLDNWLVAQRLLRYAYRALLRVTRDLTLLIRRW